MHSFCSCVGCFEIPGALWLYNMKQQTWRQNSPPCSSFCPHFVSCKALSAVWWGPWWLAIDTEEYPAHLNKTQSGQNVDMWCTGMTTGCFYLKTWRKAGGGGGSMTYIAASMSRIINWPLYHALSAMPQKVRYLIFHTCLSNRYAKIVTRRQEGVFLHMDVSRTSQAQTENVAVTAGLAGVNGGLRNCVEGV